MFAPDRSQHRARRTPRRVGHADAHCGRWACASRRCNERADRGVARTLCLERGRRRVGEGPRTMNRDVTIRTAVVPALLIILALSGCASTMSGVGGTDSYGCKAPQGAICTSVSGVYANSRQSAPKPTEKAPALTAAAYGAPSIVHGASSGASSNTI